MAIGIGGLASGLDTQAIIQKLIEVERRPAVRLESEIGRLQQYQAVYAGLAVRIADLQAAAEGLNTGRLNGASLEARQPPSRTVFSAAATAAALDGRHEIIVSQLAQAHRIASQTFSEPSAAGIASGDGVFTVRSGASGALVSVPVTAATSLNSLAAAVNAAAGGVSASVVGDGTGGDSWRLVLTAGTTGAAGEIEVAANDTLLDFENTRIEPAVPNSENTGDGTVTSSGTYTGSENKTYLIQVIIGGGRAVARYKFSDDGGLTWDDGVSHAGYAMSAVPAPVGGNTEGVDAAFSETGTFAVGDVFSMDVSTPALEDARDAVFTLDGITQTRPANTVTEALAGVTIDLLGSDPAAAGTFTVARDDSAAVDAVKRFVAAYNSVHDAVKSQQGWDPEQKKGGPLLGDPTANALMARIRETLIAPADGSGGAIRRLVDVGVRTAASGRVELDETRLRALLKTDRDAVIGVLASTSKSDSPLLEVTARPPGRPAGAYAVEIVQAPAKAAALAAGMMIDVLAADETLSFSYTDEATAASPGWTDFTVVLPSGSTLARSVDELNSAFATRGVGLRALSSAGTLKIEAAEYGGEYRFTVASDTAAGAGTTRIGLDVIDAQGVTVSGTIGGGTAAGTGATLAATAGGPVAGLAVTYTGSGTGTVGLVTLTTGLGDRFASLVHAISEGDASLLGARGKALADTIKDLKKAVAAKEDQLARVQARLETRFAAMEKALAAIKAQGEYLGGQLSALSASYRREG